MSIQFWHGLQKGPVLDSFKSIVYEWNKTSPHQIELKDYDKYYAPADEALAASPQDQPSLILAPEFQTGKMLTALGEKKVVPVTQFLDDVKLSRFANLVKLTFGDREGNLNCLPFNPSCGVLFTNKDILELVGRPRDFVPQSLEELEEVCKEAVSRGFAEAGYTCAWPPAYLIEIPAAQQDLPLVEPENGRQGFGDYQMGAEWLKRHLLDLRQLQKDHIFRYSGQTNETAKDPFVNRKVVFFMQGSTHLPILQKDVELTSKPFEIGCGPLPTLVRGQTEKCALPLGGAAIWTLNNPQTEKMAEGVRAFLNYLSSEEVQERWHKETAYVPALATLPAKLEEFHKNNPLHKAVVLQTLEAAIGQHSFGVQMPNYAEARKELFTLIEKILEAESDTDAELLLKEFDAKFSTKQ